MSSPEKKRRVDPGDGGSLGPFHSPNSSSPPESYSPLLFDVGGELTIGRNLHRPLVGNSEALLTFPPVSRNLFPSTSVDYRGELLDNSGMSTSGTPTYHHAGTPGYLSRSLSSGFAQPISQSQRSSMLPVRHTLLSTLTAGGSIVTQVPHCAPPALPETLLGQTGLFRLSPFGAYCSKCATSVHVTSASFKHHLLTYHPHHSYGSISFDDLERSAAIEVSRLFGHGDFSPFVSGESELGFLCARCGLCVKRRSNMQRHCSIERNDCERSDTSPVQVFNTICGRVVLASMVLSQNIPAGRRIPYSQTEAWLARHVSRDEKAKQYVSLFHPLAPTDLLMSRLVENWTLRNDESNPDLVDLLLKAETWLTDRALHDVGCVPANFRAAIQVFDGQDVAGVSINYTYTLRHYPESLKQELKRLLCFSWRRSRQLLSRRTISSYIDDYKNICDDEFLIPDILCALFVESTPSFYEHPMVVEFCIARLCRSRGGSLSMIKCDLASSQVASTMSILKAAVCSHLCKYTVDVETAADLLGRQVKACRVSNILCPVIRLCKQMHQLKGIVRPKTISPEGDIAVESFEFPKAIWSRLIPLVYRTSLDLLYRLLDGDKWVRVLDSSVPITVKVAQGDAVSFKVGYPGCVDTIFCSSEIVVKADFEKVEYDRLVSYLSLAFFGLSGGVIRGTEVDKVDFSQSTFHRNTFYYKCEVLKAFSFRSSGRVKTVEHKLPAVFARQYLLLRIIAESMVGVELTRLLPRRVGSRITMADAPTELFSFPSPPSVTQIRQFFVAVSAFLFPDGSCDGIMATTAEVAELSGHSAATHRTSYGSNVYNGRELIYRTFHRAYGADECSALDQSPSDTPLTPGELLRGLRLLVGPGADWTSPRQGRMVGLAASLDGRHAHIGLSCGSGKAMVWMAMLVARIIAGRSHKTIFVVLPYKFLMEHHLESAKSKGIEASIDMSIFGFTADDIGMSALPPCLADQLLLPDLCFLTMEALGKLVTYHALRIKEWVTAGLIHRIVLDEVHTIFAERFRSAYDVLPRVVCLNVPMITMSGSLPAGFKNHLLFHLGMCTPLTLGDVDLVESDDLLGTFPTGFRFYVKENSDHVSRAVEEAKHVLTRNPKHGIHIIVNSKKEAENVFQELSMNYESKIVTADSTSEEQALVAKQWSEGAIQLLVSTTIALVGNENSACRHVLVVGYLFNLINLVQAVGRLRPRQRQTGGSFGVFLPLLLRRDFQRKEQMNTIEFAALRAKRLIGGDRGLFDRLLTTKGINDWAIDTVSCRVLSLSKVFGFERGACLVCDTCVGGVSMNIIPATNESAIAASAAEMVVVHSATKRVVETPVEHTARVRTGLSKEQNQTRNRAILVLKGLEEKCLFCGKVNCNGEGCLKGCFNCGKNHYKSKCPEKDSVAKALRGKACYQCFDPHSRQGYVQHSPQECILKRRLRRLIFKKTQNSDATLAQVLGSVYSSDATFYTYVSSCRR